MRTLATLAAALAVAVSAATASEPPLLVVGFSKIGALKVRGATPGLAKKAFGKPVRVRDDRDSCTYFWPGVEIGFYSLVRDEQCVDGNSFGAATISGPWVTDRGLRKGDSVAKAKRLYPPARKARAGASTISLVVRFSQAIGEYGLTAKVSHGRVVTLYIDDPQGGE